MHNQKGQLSLFIIVGMVILIAVAFVLYLRTPSPEAPQQVDTLGLQAALRACTEDAATRGIVLLFVQGGRIYDQNDTLFTGHTRVAYHVRNGTITAPSIETMERELASFIDSQLVLCPITATVPVVRSDAPSTTTTLGDDAVIIRAHYPLSATYGGKTIREEEATVTLPLRAGRILRTATQLSHALAQGTRPDPALLLSMPLRVNMLPLDRTTTLYAVVDSQSQVNGTPLALLLAVETRYNSPPSMEFVPDAVVLPNKAHVIVLNATDPDHDPLSYTATGASITHNIATVPPHDPGDYPVRLCVSDRIDTDCTSITIRVRP